MVPPLVVDPPVLVEPPRFALPPVLVEPPRFAPPPVLVEPGPWVIVAKVSENAPSSKPMLDYVLIKRRFMAAMGTPESGSRPMDDVR